MKEKNKVPFYGLFGVNGDGVLTTPNGKYSIKLPKRVAFWLHRKLNWY